MAATNIAAVPRGSKTANRTGAVTTRTGLSFDDAMIRRYKRKYSTESKQDNKKLRERDKFINFSALEAGTCIKVTGWSQVSRICGSAAA